MSATTGIEWTDSTWNPLRGCSRVSEGCRNCYAERFALRQSGPGRSYEGLAVLKNGHASWTGKVELVEKHLLDPLKWGPVFADCPVCGAGQDDTCMHRSRVSPEGRQRPRPRRIFVNSMSDLFHENLPDEWIDRIFAVMALSPQHIFQVLTKRPERMLRYFSGAGGGGRREDRIQRQATELMLGSMTDRLYEATLTRMKSGWGGLPLKHVWLGVSVENQAAADERIPVLLQTPAAVRFISAEPLLGPVNLCAVPDDKCRPCEFSARYSPCGDLDWVICGGESGPGARPMHPDWARSLRDQCAEASVPFFFKQWGEWGPTGYSGGPPCKPEQRGQLVRGIVASSTDKKAEGSAVFHAMPAEEGRTEWRVMTRVGKHAAGALLDHREHRDFPEPRP